MKFNKALRMADDIIEAGKAHSYSASDFELLANPKSVDTLTLKRPRQYAQYGESRLEEERFFLGCVAGIADVAKVEFYTIVSTPAGFGAVFSLTTQK